MITKLSRACGGAVAAALCAGTLLMPASASASSPTTARKCYDVGKLVKAMTGLKEKTPSNVKKVLLDLVQDQSKKPEIARIIDDAAARGGDEKAVAKAAFEGLASACPELKPLAKMVSKQG
ncbi:hypothetical protein [Actinomadura oligospora]|uniref:hypothetical protein n=1 Tax=Actinomadura oligospora TaxID=111804 RepID=UPI00047EFC7F|nr:hypothetical protein [Actinomadura oligospora]